MWSQKRRKEKRSTQKLRERLENKRNQPTLGSNLSEDDPLNEYYPILEKLVDVEQTERLEALIMIEKWLETYRFHIKTNKDMRRFWTAIMRSFWLIDGRPARFQMIEDVVKMLTPNSVKVGMSEGTTTSANSKKKKKKKNMVANTTTIATEETDVSDWVSRWWVAYFRSFERQYEKLDEYRVDKYLLLQKRAWEEMVSYMNDCDWNHVFIDKLAFLFRTIAPFSDKRNSPAISVVDNGLQLQILTYWNDNFTKYLTNDNIVKNELIQTTRQKLEDVIKAYGELPFTSPGTKNMIEEVLNYQNNNNMDEQNDTEDDSDV